MTRNHFSPTFSNKPWARDGHFVRYFRDHRAGKIKQETKGRKAWGRIPGLYPDRVEHALDRELENEAALVHQKLLNFEEPSTNERIVWTQYLLSLCVRTPTFMRYEDAVRGSSGSSAIRNGQLLNLSRTW